jgi:hydrogenase maturation protein HypF
MTQMQESRTIQRRSLIVHGIVQGVGFRPFVYRLALRYRLAGFVLNDSRGVTIEIEGLPAQLDTFEYLLRQEAPPLARIDTIASGQIEPRNETTFRIVHSQESAERSALISPDTATCDDCLRELFDPCDRRYGYPFINCTNCGPRFTIVQDIPYDRRNTTMQAFPMCPDCQTEYDDPLSRRFHAQPNACPLCGPQVDLTWITPHTTETRSALHNVIATAAHHLAKGEILAIKGLGGYHLACDALNNEAVTRLRQRKHREAKPFALMVPDVATASQFGDIIAQEAALLC